MSKPSIIALDADDTLWVNEPFFRETEDKFCGLLEDFMPHHSISQELYKIEMQNMELYGYGIKAFMLSMVETVYKVTDHKASLDLVSRVIELGKDMLAKPVELLPGVEEVLKQLQGKYRLVLATKGDLLDQERKLIKSGLAKYFHHIEVMSNKKQEDYQRLFGRLDCRADQFLMVGNSIKSDVLPVLELGGQAVHIPFHTTWVHEEVKKPIQRSDYVRLSAISELIDHLDNIQ
ncbi:MAG: HAD family hydrolase [Bacteroidota bacterium]